MTSSHVLFIPAVMLLGVFIGFILGSRAKADQANLEAKRDEERAVAREARAARKAKAASESEASE